MIDWPSLLRDYLLSLQTRGHTVGTLETAARALKVWRAWYQGEGLLSPGDVTRADLDRFHEALRTTPGKRVARLGPLTIDRIMLVVRDLLRWAVKREHLLLRSDGRAVAARGARAAAADPDGGRSDPIAEDGG